MGHKADDKKWDQNGQKMTKTRPKNGIKKEKQMGVVSCI